MRLELKIKRRLLVLVFGLIILFVIIGIRIGNLTLIQGEVLKQRGIKQWTKEGVVTAHRGDIMDTKGEKLVVSTTAYVVTVNPSLVKDDALFAQFVAPILDTTSTYILDKIKHKNYGSVTLKRQVSREKIDEIRALKNKSEEFYHILKPISFDEDSKRWYAKGGLLAQVLGITNVDGKGQSGIELKYQDVLKGQRGYIKTETDRQGRLLPDGEMIYVPSIKGGDVVLTIDSTIQSICEKAVRECIAYNHAKKVSCIVMEANTGAILAMAMQPTFDPNHLDRSNVQVLQEQMRIPVIQDAYEPGSVFKVLTLAAALDSEKVSLKDTFHCTGQVHVDGDRIRCWKNSHGHQTLSQALNNSCNPAFVKIALQTGKETLYKYLQTFGLGQKTGIELLGEGQGIVIPVNKVKDVDLARIGFGQSVAVTPLQMVNAFNAVINGGRLMQPYIVKEVIDDQGETVLKTHPTVLYSPIKEETSKQMTKLLQDVVQNGGGKNAYIEGYHVGGKTGTAQFYQNGRIVKDMHIGSFIGFAPVQNPLFTVLLTVSEADVPIDYGGTTAAPFAREIIEGILTYKGILKDSEKEQEKVTVPYLVGLKVKEGEKLLNKCHLYAQTDGMGAYVKAQLPVQGAKVLEGTQVMLYTYEEDPKTPMDMVLIPDVIGENLVSANRTLRKQHLNMSVTGSGIAIAQSPKGGSYIEKGSTIQVTFSLPDTMGE